MRTARHASRHRAPGRSRIFGASVRAADDATRDHRQAPSFWTHLAVATAAVSLAAATALGLGMSQADAAAGRTTVSAAQVKVAKSAAAQTKAAKTKKAKAAKAKAAKAKKAKAAKAKAARAAQARLTMAASLVPMVRHELPFVCGTSWTSSTRSAHSPSPYAVDFNTPGDHGQPVLASARGRVAKADNASTTGYGRHVVLDHGNGETTVYAHLDKVFVAAGTTIEQGTLVGNLGTTGNSTGSHLHYEQKIGSHVIPARFAGAKLKYGTAASRNCADVPVAADLLEGNGTEVAVFRRSASSSFVVRRADGRAVNLAVGQGFHEPVVGDWDGDGQTEIGTWDPRTYSFTLAGEAAFYTVKVGTRGDRPVVGDFDGDGVTELGVRRGTKFRLKITDDGESTVIALGDTDDIAVTGDWDGDGVTDLGVYDPSTSVFTLRTVVAGKVVTRTVAHGAAGDVPVVGDWNNDGITDLGTWDPSTATFAQRLLTTSSVSRGTLGRTSVVVWGNRR